MLRTALSRGCAARQAAQGAGGDGEHGTEHRSEHGAARQRMKGPAGEAGIERRREHHERQAPERSGDCIGGGAATADDPGQRDSGAAHSNAPSSNAEAESR